MVNFSVLFHIFYAFYKKFLSIFTESIAFLNLYLIYYIVEREHFCFNSYSNFYF